MRKYQELVREVLMDGNYKENRTGVDTISKFGVDYKINNYEGFPLLTTKKMDGYRWESLIHELLWYLSGDEHIKVLQEKTSIWDEWADEEGHLDTAYGRFWRRAPIPHSTRQFEGESWAHSNNEFVNENELTVDQLGYVIKELKENPNSRRLVVNAWNPANATVSTLPPCHYSFAFNVQNDNKLNLHLTQRSGDIALGIPFNIACYAILQRVVAQLTGLEVGEFKHSITDAHIYCGKGDRGKWYKDNLKELQASLNRSAIINDDFMEFWMSTMHAEDENNYDHVPGLLEQLRREPLNRPSIDIAEVDSLDNLTAEDIQLEGYDHYDPLQFGVAE